MAGGYRSRAAGEITLGGRLAVQGPLFDTPAWK
jgi:hypothetical protein